MKKSEEDEEDGVEVIESENVEDDPKDGEEPEEEDETEEEKERDTKNKKSRAKADKESPAPKKKKSGIPMVGLVVTLLGAIGIVGAVLLDPIMNMMDASHPAAIAIGSMQMIGIAVAAIVLVVGIVIAVVMRK